MQLQRQYRDGTLVEAPPNVVYVQLKYIWAEGRREETLSYLRDFSATLARNVQPVVRDQGQSSPHDQALEGLAKLLARCYFKTGEWQVALEDDWSKVSNTSQRG